MSEERPSTDPETEQAHGPVPIRVQCECGGVLGLVMMPNDDPVFQAVCPSCGTRYRRTPTQLEKLAEHGRRAVVILPRSRPRG